MGWQDAPIVQKNSAPAWQSAPIVTPAPAKPKAPQQSTAGALWDAAKNTAAGVAQGVVSLPDMLISGTNAVNKTIDRGFGIAGETALSVLGMPGAAKTFRQASERNVARPGLPTYGGAIEAVTPTPQNSSARTARTIAQFAGGLVSPANKYIPGGQVAPPSFPKVPVAPSEVVAEGSKRGVRVMTSDVIPPKTIIGKAARGLGEKIPFAGTSGPRAAQAGERVAAVKDFVNQYGGANPGALDAVTDNLIKTRGAAIGKLVATKDSVIKGISGNVPVDRTLTKIDEQIAVLKGINAPAYAPVITKLEQFKGELAQGKTLDQIEGNRKLLGDLFTDPSLAAIKTDGQKALNKIYAPLRAEMGTYIRSMGGAQKFSAWQSANQKLASLAGELDNATLRGVLKTGEDTPENVAKLLFSAKKSDVSRLYQNLSPVGRSRAQAAILHRAMEKAQSIAPDGNAVISPERFVNEVSKLGQSVGVFFKGGDAQAVEGLTRLINATRQAGVANINPTTGAQVLPYAIYGAFTSALGPINGALAAGGTGLLARAYESAPVRDLLLRLAKTRQGSKQEAAILAKIGVAISAVGERVKVNSLLNDNIASAAAASDGKEQHQQ